MSLTTTRLSRWALLPLFLLNSNCSFEASNETGIGSLAIRPLDSFNPPANLDDLKDYSVRYNGAGGPTTQIYSRFGYSGNGDKWGNFGFSDQTLTIDRSDITGPCSLGATAPNCNFTWGNGSTGIYKGHNTNLFPEMDSNKNKWSDIALIKATIEMQLLTGNLAGGFASCGLNLGLGNSVGTHTDLPLLPTTLDINERGSRSDMIMFSYNIVDGGSDRFRVELPINNASDSSLTDDSIWDTTFNMTENAPLLSNSDYVKFEITLIFQQSIESIKIYVKPVATNKDLSNMQEQKIEWPYFAPTTHQVDGENRSGVSVDHVGGLPLTKSDIENSYVTVGFHANGVVKKCALSNLVIKLNKN